MSRLALRTRFITASALCAALIVGFGAPPAGAGASHSLIQGSGSSWSSNAVNQWVADVQSSGLQVVYTASGSAQGRKDFGYQTTDFAVSDIGYLGKDPVTGDEDSSQGRAYSYLPVVAGGTSFPYQLRVAGQLVRNLRLSGQTLTKIFTNQITNWNDPAITADNNGHALPSLPIIPVVHSEGSGSTAQFTRYLDRQYPDLWHAYSGASGLTEYYPRKGQQIAQNGSDGVMNFISSSAANGAIGYDEYSYALAKDYPVVKLENQAGYFTAPTQYNVAVALTQAQINLDKSSPDYLLQNLDRVYVYGDPRTYAMSSYSYMIIPTAANDQKMTTAKRQTLADFLYYSICQGQRETGPIGYSPLPINLVQASFDQVGKLHQADAGVDLSKRDVTTCNNPTFVAGQPSRNYLAEIAPQPGACDKAGTGPCVEGVSASGNGNPTGNGQAPSATGPAAGGAVTSVSTGPAATIGATKGVTTRDPKTGRLVAQGAGSTSLTDAQALAVPTILASSDPAGAAGVFGPLAALFLVLALIGPPLLARRMPAGRDPR